MGPKWHKLASGLNGGAQLASGTKRVQSIPSRWPRMLTILPYGLRRGSNGAERAKRARTEIWAPNGLICESDAHLGLKWLAVSPLRPVLPPRDTGSDLKFGKLLWHRVLTLTYTSLVGIEGGVMLAWPKARHHGGPSAMLIRMRRGPRAWGSCLDPLLSLSPLLGSALARISRRTVRMLRSESGLQNRARG